MPTIPKNPKFPFKAYGTTGWSWPPQFRSVV